MKLYYFPGACSIAPHIVAREAGIPLELEKVDLGSKRTATGEDYVAVNPKGYVPALRLDDGSVLTEVSALIQYLADRAPASRPHPGRGNDGALPRARMDRLHRDRDPQGLRPPVEREARARGARGRGRRAGAPPRSRRAGARAPAVPHRPGASAWPTPTSSRWRAGRRGSSWTWRPGRSCATSSPASARGRRCRRRWWPRASPSRNRFRGRDRERAPVRHSTLPIFCTTSASFFASASQNARNCGWSRYCGGVSTLASAARNVGSAAAALAASRSFAIDRLRRARRHEEPRPLRELRVVAQLLEGRHVGQRGMAVSPQRREHAHLAALQVAHDRRRARGERVDAAAQQRHDRGAARR